MVKAYRQLEHERLAGGRPGQGTFITATPSPAPPTAQEDLRASLEAWLRAAEEAGMSDEAVTALITAARHDIEIRQAAGLLGDMSPAASGCTAGSRAAAWGRKALCGR